jgi:hypothetical protein
MYATFFVNCFLPKLRVNFQRKEKEKERKENYNLVKIIGIIRI